MKALYKKNRIKQDEPKLQEKATILVDNGLCSLETNINIFGIEIQFEGKAEIEPELPEGWILQGNNNTLLMICLQNNPIQNSPLFNYKGLFEIKNVIICNIEGKKLSEKIKRNYSNWAAQSFDLSTDTSNWESYKDTKRVGKVKKTKYNLPEYNLPKLEKEEIKKIQKKQTQTQTIPQTYTTGGSGSGSSGGSGGY